MIKVAETAKKKVSILMREEGFDPFNDYVRVGVKSGGCSGLSYDLKFDHEFQDEDKLFEDNQVKILVDKAEMLIGFRKGFRKARIKKKRDRKENNEYLNDLFS